MKAELDHERKKKLLFVDDEIRILESLSRILRNERDRWIMTFMNDPTKVMEFVKKESPDVAVLDFNMPGIDGLTLLSMLKSDDRTSETEIIMLTGLDDRSLKRKALDLNAVDLLNKPVVREDLIARVKNALRLKEYKEELKSRNELLRKRLVEAQKLELVGILAAGATHDFKNILHLILGFNELAREYLKEDEPAYGHLLRVQKVATHANQVVMKILALTRNTAETMEIFRIDDIVRESVELIKATLRTGFELDTEIKTEDIEFFGNQTEIFQIIMNLAMNARYAMQDGGRIGIIFEVKKFDVPLRLHNGGTLPSGDYCIITVSDTGPGIAPEILENLFEPMFTTSDKGFGLGLEVVSYLVTKYNGGINVKSTPGEGAVFSIYLPLQSDLSRFQVENVII